MSEQVILDALKRLENKVDANTEATGAATLGIAVLGERLQNTMEKVDNHLESDAKMHERLEKFATDAKEKAVVVEREHNNLATKITTVASLIAVVFTLLASLAKDAIASAFNIGQ